MNICHICSYAENVLFTDVVDELKKRGVGGRLYFFWPYGSKPKNSSHEYVDVRNCYNKIDRVLFYLKHKKVYKDFDKYLEDKEFDLMYAHSLFSNGYLAYKNKIKNNTPYIVYVQNTDINVFFKYRFYLRKLGINILKNADRIIFSSNSYRDYLMNKYIHDENDRSLIWSKSVVIPYGINQVFFENNTNDIEKICSNRDNEINVLTVGMICNNKNQKTVTKALDILKRRGFKVNYTVIGKNGNNSLYKSLNRRKDTTVLSYMSKSDLKGYYASSDVFCLPSKTETFGLVYAEALSQGLPVIYSRGQGFDQQFPDGTIGYAVSAKSSKDIADTIIKIKNKNRVDFYNQCKLASHKFEWNQVMDLYLNLINSI